MDKKIVHYQCIRCREIFDVEITSKYHRKYVIHEKDGAWASQIEKKPKDNFKLGDN